MRERVASLDGRLSIADREEGKGVMLIVEIPLPASTGNAARQEPLSESAA